VRELNVPSMKKITADDYGVDVVPERNESNEPEMPDLRDLANFDSSFEKTQYVPKNATAVLKRNTGTQSKSYIRLADDFIMHRDMDKNGPELAAMPEWGAITENYSFITTEFTSMHIAYLDRVNYFKDLVGEVKIVDKYATRKEVNRLLHSKWTVHKRDKTEVIARLEGRNHIDLRYREGKGLEIVASTDESMSALFKMNVKENLSSIADIANARSRCLEEVDMINSTYLAVPALDSRIKAGICSIGNSVLKSFENHQGFYVAL